MVTKNNATEKLYRFEIAGTRIQFISDNELAFPVAYTHYRSDDKTADITVYIQQEHFSLEDGKLLFEAPYPFNPSLKKTLWQVYETAEGKTICCENPLDTNSKVWATCLKDQQTWHMFNLPSFNGKLQPMLFPFGNLFLYYMLYPKNFLVMHSSSVNLEGKAFIFFGESGRGKSTIAQLFAEKHFSTIHDDINIIKQESSDFLVYNAPFSEPYPVNKGLLDKLFLLKHGKENHLRQLSVGEASTQLAAHSIHHNFDVKQTEKLFEKCFVIANRCPVYELHFKPDHEIVNLLTSL